MAKSKSKTFFLCRNCGSMHVKWLGKCPDCGTWDSLEEVAKATEDLHKPRALTVGRLASESPWLTVTRIWRQSVVREFPC